MSAAASSKLDETAVEFNRDIRPILSDKCFACHGPDEKKRLTKLRFDTEEGAFADLGGGRFAIVPDSPGESGLVSRITTDIEAQRMPPAYSGKKLTEQEIDLLQRWVSQGAKWQKHWSFIPPRRPELANLEKLDWARNGLDHFVLQRLEQEGLSPSPEADPATLIRRVTLDLTGLPPTLDELDAFLADASTDAYEKVVDRLLESPRYAEKMASRWLDAARYADTNGYQTDAERSMWRWRDWVINAFDQNMSFDQFTIEQIAGDMLPNATLEQKIASGFNRNHRGNGEGGIVPEEYSVEYVVDRVETTSTVWLGLTMGCARCHDHKYDPIKQKDFYRVFAYFNNVPERGRAFKYGNSAPFIPAPTSAQSEQLRQLEEKLAEAEEQFELLGSEIEKLQRTWEASLAQSSILDWSFDQDLLLRYSLDGVLAGQPGGFKDGKPVQARLVDGMPHFVPGTLGAAASFDGKRFLDVGDVAELGFFDRFSLSAWVYPTAPDGPILGRNEDKPEVGEDGFKGYGLYLKDGRVQLNLVTRWLDDSLRVETAEPLELNRWHHVTATYDGSRVADGAKIYLNGRPSPRNVRLDLLNQDFRLGEPLRIGGAGARRFSGLIDEVRVYTEVLSPQEVAVIALTDSVNQAAALTPDSRSQSRSDKLLWCFLDQYAPPHIHKSWQQLQDLRRQKRDLVRSFPTVMVMHEGKTRDTFVLVRGAYDKPGEKVLPGVPSFLPQLRKDWDNNRIGLARWLVAPENPLTARVTVNRFWQTYFGVGLVKTAEDFGSQGEWPLHLELLDWLATDFVSSGWDVKALQKTIVMSATYRQSSKVSPEVLKRDPENRLLAHGPRFRLPAEVVRDQALAVSGLLVEQVGGASVKPYQPAGLWSDLAGGEDYQRGEGSDLYRRSLYTFWKRTSAPPSMTTFDSGQRETCSVRQERTNTPLQALNLMNDVTYVEASRVLAQRMMQEGGKTAAERIAFAYKMVTARTPRSREGEILLEGFQHYLRDYRDDRKAALELVSQGEHPRNPALDIAELASYTTVASLILNLDQAITKE